MLGKNYTHVPFIRAVFASKLQTQRHLYYLMWIARVGAGSSGRQSPRNGGWLGGERGSRGDSGLLLGNVSVSDGGANVLVAQPLLNECEVRAGAHHLASCEVLALVRVTQTTRDACADGNRFKQAEDLTAGERATLPRCE